MNKTCILFAGVWTANGCFHEAVLEIGKRLKERLNIPPTVSFGYQLHEDSSDTTSASVKYVYTL